MKLTNRSPEERAALSRFDTVFLFSFTAITITSTLLSSLTGTLGGLLPVLILFMSAYPFYIGVWHGIMNDQVQERIFAWTYIALELAYLITTLTSCLLSTILPFAALETNILGIIVSKMLELLLIFIVLLLFASRLTRRINRAIRKVFRQNLPSAKTELTEKEIDKTIHKHALFGSIFLSTTPVVEVLAIQEWFLATGILTAYAIPYNIEGILYSIALFLFVWAWSYLLLS